MCRKKPKVKTVTVTQAAPVPPPPWFRLRVLLLLSMLPAKPVFPKCKLKVNKDNVVQKVRNVLPFRLHPALVLA